MRSGLRSLITLAVCFPAVAGLALMLSVATVARAQDPPVAAFVVGSWDQYSGTYADIWGDGDYAYLPNYAA